jgi:hypothetical protein
MPEPAGHSADGASEYDVPNPGIEPIAPQLDACTRMLPTLWTGEPSSTKMD